MERMTLGVLVGNRGFFPGHLCATGRSEMIAAVEAAGFAVEGLPIDATPFGAVESISDARKAADHLRTCGGRIDGIIVTLPNFGDEKAVANALRWGDLGVPVLVHAFPDSARKMTVADRRDSFCGKMSVCNNLRQYGIPFTLTRRHTDAVSSDTFRADLAEFGATCRSLRALRNLRIGAIGARPTAFNTVRYSEKLLEKHGISVETLDLFECFGRVGRLADDAPAVQAKLAAIQSYVETGGVPAAAVLKMAKLGAVIDEWMRTAQLQASALQCWTAMEEFYGVVPCTVMSMMSNERSPSACEVDVVGAAAMHVLAQVSGRPAALVDWNNNYGDDADKAVVFHCSNLPKDLFKGSGSEARMEYQEILAGTVGKENAYGTIYGRVAPGEFTYLRISTDDEQGVMRAYVGEGELTGDPLLTFGGYGVVRVPEFQRLLRHICENGFEHHVSITPGRHARGIAEALAKYRGWQVHLHE